MTDNFISGEITPTIKTHLEGFIASFIAEMPFLKSATLQQRKKLPKMGRKSVDFVEKAYQAGKNHPDLILSTFDYDAFDKDMALKDNLTYFRQMIQDLLEKMNDTELLLGVDLIKQALYILAALQLAAKDNEDVKNLVAELSASYRQVSSSAANTYSIAPSASITVVNVVTGKLFVNNGTTILKFKSGNDLAGRPRTMDPITVDPGNSATIPKGWTSIEITNISATTEGSFSVKVK
ncbi:MAG: hypothetical protein WCQ95_01855 [Bacteroidota bacterium]